MEMKSTLEPQGNNTVNCYFGKAKTLYLSYMFNLLLFHCFS